MSCSEVKRVSVSMVIVLLKCWLRKLVKLTCVCVCVFVDLQKAP